VNTGTFSLSFSRGMRLMLTAMFAGPRHSRVYLAADSMTVRMGWHGWAFSAVIPRSSIAEVQPYSARVLSWGAHGWRGQWLVNGSSRGLVRLRLSPSAPGRCLVLRIRIRELIVSLEDPTGFISAVRADT
jgi:hypothetical protein